MFSQPLGRHYTTYCRECLTFSSCKSEYVRLCWEGQAPTLLSNAWRIRFVLCRTKSAIFQGRPKCPLLVGLCLQSRLHHALPFLGTHTLYATRQTLIATKPQIVRTPNGNAASNWVRRDSNPSCHAWHISVRHLHVCRTAIWHSPHTTRRPHHQPFS